MLSLNDSGSILPNLCFPIEFIPLYISPDKRDLIIVPPIDNKPPIPYAFYN